MLKIFQNFHGERVKDLKKNYTLFWKWHSKNRIISENIEKNLENGKIPYFLRICLKIQQIFPKISQLLKIVPKILQLLKIFQNFGGEFVSDSKENCRTTAEMAEGYKISENMERI